MLEHSKSICEGYKTSKVGEIPMDWEDNTIGDLIKFEGGQQPPRKYFINEEKEGYIRLIQIRDYKTDKFKTYIPTEMAKRFCSEDDIMIGRYGPPIFQILRGISGSYNVALIKAIPSEKLLKSYAYYYLCREDLFNLIERLSQRTSGQTGVDMAALKAYPLPLPSLKEQQKIADILSTVDEQILNSDEIIKKIKQLKMGLMSHLLTKGIGHTEFKESEVGEIPKEWEVKSISEIAITSSGGTPNRQNKDYYVNGTIPWIKTGELKNKYIHEAGEYITEKAVEKSSAKWVEPNSVVVAMYGATIGQTAILKFPATTNQACCSIKPIKDLLSEEYLYYYLKFSVKNLINMGAGGAQPNISQQIIKKYQIGLPLIEEQQKIAEILSSVDEQIEGYEKEKEKYIELKKGLMEQLLTGKLRVTV